VDAFLKQLRFAVIPAACLALLTACPEDDGDEGDSAAEGGTSGDSNGGSGNGGSGNGGSGNGSGDGDASLEEVVDAAVALSEEISGTFARTCDCWEEFGFMSEDQCSMSIPVIDTSLDRDCVLDALSSDPEAAIANFVCERPYVQGLADCLSDALDACDIAAFEACSEEMEPDCPELPAEVDAAVEACTME
jgi:hypothetical protein